MAVTSMNLGLSFMPEIQAFVVSSLWLSARIYRTVGLDYFILQQKCKVYVHTCF